MSQVPVGSVLFGPGQSPVSVEVRYSSMLKYNEGVASYARVHGQMLAIQGRGGSVSSFKVNDATELRLFRPQAGNMRLADHTISYWQISGDTHARLQAVYDSLGAAGYDRIEAPHESGGTGGPRQQRTERAVLRAPDGTLRGIIINPPYPNYTGNDEGATWLPPTGTLPLGPGLLLLLAALLLAGLAGRRWAGRVAVG